MPTTNRASLLNGLRTGGVRSSSASSFNISRHDNTDLLQNNNLYFDPSITPLNPNSAPFTPSHLHTPQQHSPPADSQLHAFHQMQLMQLEILRLQNVQAQRNQQVQAAVLAEALRQQARRSPVGFVPTSPGPIHPPFDLASNTPPPRRPSQVDLLKAQLGVSTAPQLDDLPMSAALGGRFGAHLSPSTIAFPCFPDPASQSSSPPKQTSVLSGGLASSSPIHHAPKESIPSRSDAAPSWRRGNTTHSVLNGLRTASSASPSVKITPPPGERFSPPLTSANKLRPRPLSFTSMASSNVPIVAIDSGSEHDDAMSSASSTSQSNPATPQSLTSLESNLLSPREEAAKKLYDGLGMGRPVPVPSLPQRLLSQPLRQPRGPPSGADELGPKNFATRIRRKAIGGLGVLMDARERRESIEVY